LSKFTDLKFFL